MDYDGFWDIPKPITNNLKTKNENLCLVFGFLVASWLAGQISKNQKPINQTRKSVFGFWPKTKNPKTKFSVWFLNFWLKNYNQKLKNQKSIFGSLANNPIIQKTKDPLLVDKTKNPIIQKTKNPLYVETPKPKPL